MRLVAGQWDGSLSRPNAGQQNRPAVPWSQRHNCRL